MREAIAAVVIVACGGRTALGTSATIDASVDVRAPAPCVRAVVTIASTTAEADAIAVDGAFVYWHDGNGVSRVPKTGGKVELVAAASPSSPWLNMAAFALAGDNVFLENETNAAMVAKSGGPVVPLPINVTYGRVAASATHAYFWSWTGTTTAISFVAADGTGLDVLPTLPVLVYNIAFDGDSAAFVAANYGVFAVALPAGTSVTLSGLPAGEIVVDHAHVYFTTITTDGKNGIQIDALDRETFATQAFADTGGTISMALSATDLYFTANDRVRKLVGKSPDDIVDVATVSADLRPDGIAVDDACVFWTNGSRTSFTATGVVMAAPL